jgi:hypothetical protein
MTEMAQSPERMERAGWFYRVIERRVIAAVSCVVSVKDYQEAMEELRPGSPRRAKNPYLAGVAYIMNGLVDLQGKIRLAEPIDWIFDDESEKKWVLEGWEVLYEDAPPAIKWMAGDTPIFRNDQTTLPLQAADLYAWWVRKWASEKDPHAGVANLDFPWKMKRNIPRIHFHPTKLNFMAKSLMSELSYKARRGLLRPK